MSRRDPYWKRLQNLVNSEALATLNKDRSRMEAPEEARATMETPEDIRSVMETYAPGGRADKLMKLRESLDSEEQTLLILRVERAMPWEDIAEAMLTDGEPVTPAVLRERFERLKEKLQRLAREQGLIE